jgi:hypothetical protein
MSHGSQPAKSDKVESVDSQKWVRFLQPGLLLLALCTLYFTRDAPHQENTVSSKTEVIGIQKKLVSQLPFDDQGEVIDEISEKTQYQLDIPAEFQIDGTARVDNTCTIKDRKVVSGELPPYKEFYIIEPVSKSIFITFKKN